MSNNLTEIQTTAVRAPHGEPRAAALLLPRGLCRRQQQQQLDQLEEEQLFRQQQQQLPGVLAARGVPAPGGARGSAGMNCVKTGLPGKLILSKRKGLQEIIFF